MKHTTLLTQTALVLIAGFVSITPSRAEQTCDGEGFCEQPAQIGKQSMNSKVSERTFLTTPPSTEHRSIADETIILRKAVPTGRANTGGKADNFASGRHELTTQERTQIESLVDRIAGKNVMRIQVIGHADQQGFDDDSDTVYRDNKSLSEGRAQEAANYLESIMNGHSAQISAIGKGASQPIVT